MKLKPCKKCGHQPYMVKCSVSFGILFEWTHEELEKDKTVEYKLRCSNCSPLLNGSDYCVSETFTEAMGKWNERNK